MKLSVPMRVVHCPSPTTQANGHSLAEEVSSCQLALASVLQAFCKSLVTARLYQSFLPSLSNLSSSTPGFSVPTNSYGRRAPIPHDVYKTLLSTDTEDRDQPSSSWSRLVLGGVTIRSAARSRFIVNPLGRPPLTSFGNLYCQLQHR
jgi:hypothetical protein